MFGDTVRHDFHFNPLTYQTVHDRLPMSRETDHDYLSYLGVSYFPASPSHCGSASGSLAGSILDQQWRGPTRGRHRQGRDKRRHTLGRV